VAIDKSKWNLGIKVSQKVIDEIKKQGMTAALKNVKTSGNAEYVEGVRRLYTPERVVKVLGPVQGPTWRVSTEDKANYQGSYQTGAQTAPATPPNSGLSGTVAAALKAPVASPVNPSIAKKAAQQTTSASVGRGGIAGVAKKPVTPNMTPAQQRVIVEAKKKLQSKAAASAGRGGIAGVSKKK
jgi:hypothetical protein